MNSFEALVDGIDFGTVANYLKSPASRIHFLLHVRDRSMLPELAASLSGELESKGFVPGQTPRCIAEMLARGELLYSARESNRPAHDSYHLDAKTIDRNAFSEVIYLEPFYLVHTAGLFEGRHRTGTGTSAQPSEVRPSLDDIRKRMAAEWAALRQHPAQGIGQRRPGAGRGIGK